MDIGPEPRGARRALWTRRAFLTLLAVVVVAGLFEACGVRSRTVTAVSGDGTTHLAVKYAQVARAGLDVPFEITVRHAGGFDGDVVIAVSVDYLGLFDRNGIEPAPSSATGTPDEVVWTFDPPPGDTLSVDLDMQVEGSRHWGRSGEVRVLDGSGAEVVHASFKTWLAP